MNNPIDPAYIAALRRKLYLPPEICGYPAQVRRDKPQLKLPAAPSLVVDAAVRFDWRDAACIAAAVVVWILAASMKVWS